VNFQELLVDVEKAVGPFRFFEFCYMEGTEFIRNNNSGFLDLIITLVASIDKDRKLTKYSDKVKFCAQHENLPNDVVRENWLAEWWVPPVLTEHSQWHEAQKRQFSLVHDLRQELSIPHSFTIVPLDEKFPIELIFPDCKLSYTSFPQPIQIGPSMKDDSIVLVTNLDYWKHWRSDQYSGFHFPSLLQSTIFIVKMDQLAVVEPIIAFIVTENPSTEYLLFLSRQTWVEDDLKEFNRCQQRILALPYIEKLRISVCPLEMQPNTEFQPSKQIIQLKMLARVIESFVLEGADGAEVEEDFLRFLETSRNENGVENEANARPASANFHDENSDLNMNNDDILNEDMHLYPTNT